MRAVVEVLAQALVDRPEDVEVTESERRGTTIVELRTAPGDMGKIIGRQGRTAAALRTLEYDLVLAGADTSDGGGGVVAAGVATLLRLPYLSQARRIEPIDGGVRVDRLSDGGHDVLEATLPAVVVGTQLLGEPRYPTLRGIMGARS